MKGDGVLFAHTLGVGGPDLELILISAALAVLGIVFFFQKAVKPVISIVLLVVALGAGVVAFTMEGEDTQQPVAETSAGTPGGASIEILSPAEGDELPANEEIEITYEIDPGDLDSDQLGDMHVYVDGELASMQVGEVLTVELEPGERSLAVEAAQPNHASFEPPVIHEIEVTAE